MREKMQLEISAWAIVKLLLVLIAFVLLYYVRDILALIFIVLILVASFKPVVETLEKKVGRLLAVILLAVGVFLLFALTIYLVVPPFVSQISDFANSFPSLLAKYDFLSNYREAIENNIKSSLGNITNSFVSITATVFGGFVTFIMAVVLTIYMLLDRKQLSDFSKSIIPDAQKNAVIETVEKVSQKVGSWFRGQLLLGAIIAAIDLIGLLIIGVPYALALALISGLLEFIPTIGPIIAGVIAAVIALSVSPIQAVFVIILYVIVQQLENAVIVPKVMQKAVGLSPVVIILAILVGAKLLGLLGAILAVPIAASLTVIVQEWPALSKSFRQE